jgi:putative FmdB family regulatory protein
MPMYSYLCSHCGHSSDEFQKMSSDPLVICPECGNHTYARVPTLPHTDLKEFNTPIEMFSIAMNDDDEIREFKRKCPDVEVETDPRHPNYGVPIARSRKQKLDALEAMGFTERN